MAEVELPNPEEIEEKKHDSFTRRAALCTAFYAVALALTSLGGSNAMKEMILAQQQASDQYAFAQAKNNREHTLETQIRILKLQMANQGATLPSDARNRYEALIAEFGKEKDRYEKEKKEIREVAKSHEDIRNENQRKDPYFDYAEVLLQIAIVMASIAMLSSSRPVFVFSLFLAVAGIVLSYGGFTVGHDKFHLVIPFVEGAAH